jgi:hypothetical protein
MIKVPNTLQEVFDIVSVHLLTQVKRCMAIYPDRIFPVCSYRNEYGMKCAAGALIPDEEYKPEMEKNNWKMLVKKAFVNNLFSNEIRELQQIHDSNIEDDIDFLKTELIKFARLRNLTHNIKV